MERAVGHLEDDMMMETTRNDRIKELRKFISPKYVGVAFNLPPACGTFWGLMEEEINKFAAEDPHPYSKDVDEVLRFLSMFFSTGLVERIGDNIHALGKSSLGIDYTLRPGKGMIARFVLDDVQLECDFEGSSLRYFLGHVDVPCDGDADGEWESQQGRRRRRKSAGGSSSGGSNRLDRAGRHLGRGAGRGAGGGRGNGEDNVSMVHFESMDRETIFVPMSPFSTPAYGDPDRFRSLKSRWWEFISHGLVGDYHAEMYDPHFSENGKVCLFHGTRTSSLISFRSRGIDPRHRRNEFSMDAAFYASNSICQAYEHPLHYHPSRILNDPISVLVFELDVRVLHGLQPPPGEISPLTNLWFRDMEEDDPAWQKFCKENFTETGTRHVYDIVIGPVCLPKDDGDYGKLSLSLPGSVALTQIAFCSSRARAWLEQSFKKAYVETRGASQASQESNAN